jgi:cytochrome c oxidase accessory protein FixG
MVMHAPAAHPEAFAWAAVLTAVLYFDFAWFREQLCLIVCPYGRLQSVLTDRDTIVIGYDSQRGEPRGKVGTTKGDCVDCNRCVVVCPTGIDIRNGLQIDCIGCARCIDACDEVMTKLERPAGLIRYDSQQGFAGAAKRLLRPRVYLYAALGVLGASVASFSLAQSRPFEANLLRLRDAPPYTLDAGRVRNAFEIHLVNKRSHESRFELRAPADPRLHFAIAIPKLTLPSLADQRVPVFVDFARGSVHSSEHCQLELWQEGARVTTIDVPLIAPE